jgi:hypothetical protein
MEEVSRLLEQGVEQRKEEVPMEEVSHLLEQGVERRKEEVPKMARTF